MKASAGDGGFRQRRPTKALSVLVGVPEPGEPDREREGARRAREGRGPRSGPSRQGGRRGRQEAGRGRGAAPAAARRRLAQAQQQCRPHKKPAPVLAARSAPRNFDSLLSQIEAEKQRIEAQKQQAAAAGAKKPAGQAAPVRRRPSRACAPKEQGTRKGGIALRAGCSRAGDAAESQAEDRYAQMAVQAEKLQRDKVLAEARAAVAAATSHEGEGRRKKRKEKREAENRERLELEAIEKGLDPDARARRFRRGGAPGRYGGEVRRDPSACNPTTSSSACSCWARCSRSPSPWATS